jgi:TPR repeat protein
LRSIFAVLVVLSGPTLAGPIADANSALDRKDYQEALSILVPLAEAGDVDALGNLGNMYAFGHGVDIDLKRAFELWQRASDKHLGTAMYNIATLYFLGKPGFAKDETEAAKWYMRAAEHKHVQSMITVSSMYGLGRALPQDKKLATAWASLAESNAKVPYVKDAATRQLNLLLTQISPNEVPEVQSLMQQLARKIDANMKSYREQ